MKTRSFFCAACSFLLLIVLVPESCVGRVPVVSVVVAEESPQLERFAAKQLCGYLKKLYDIDVQPATAVDSSAQRVWLIGTPETNPLVATAIGEEAWPELSDQGIVLLPRDVDGKPGLVIGGGTPQATAWAVYELVERWGVRYLLHGDVLPDTPGPLGLPGERVVMEPEFAVRQWRVVNDFACGPESWGMADYRLVLGQLAKMKFNRILISIYPWQPFLHFEVDGVARRSCSLWFDFHYPITPDMPGRHLFDDRAEFWNPDLPLGASYEETAAAGERLMHRLMDCAHRHGMQCALVVPLPRFPAEFKELIPGSRRFSSLRRQTIAPGPDTDLDDPGLTRVSAAMLRAAVNTYPEVDSLVLGMPEQRSWVGEHERAWKGLDATYELSDVASLEKILEQAGRRKDYPGGAERAVNEIKGDLPALYFYDRLLRKLDVLANTSKPDIPVIYYAVAEELFPLLEKILPRGSETLNFVDYTPVRILKRQETLSTLGGTDVPATLIYTLHDDNVGIVPMLATSSLHKLNEALRRHDWAGFSTRYWLVSDHDPCLAYLARASWDAEATPRQVYADLVGQVCGERCVPDMLEAFEQIEKTTELLEMKFLGLSFPTPGMYARYRDPAASEQVRRGYRLALAAVRRARAETRPAGEPFLDYWIGRLEFGIGYFDCLQAAHRAMTLKSESDQARKQGDTETATKRLADAAAEMERAVGLSRSMLETYARVARDQSDAGAIATMAEYVYRPLKSRAAAWSRDRKN